MLYWNVLGWKLPYTNRAAFCTQSVEAAVKKPATITGKLIMDRAKISGIIPDELTRSGMKDVPACLIILPPRIILRE